MNRSQKITLAMLFMVIVALNHIAYAQTLQVEYSTFVQSNGYAHSISVDNRGRAFIQGATCLANFPTTSGCYFNNPIQDGQYNPYLFVLNPDGDGVAYFTYTGRNTKVFIDLSGGITFFGSTDSPDFPAMPNPDSCETYFHKINLSGSQRTFLSHWKEPCDFLIDSNGHAIVYGTTASDSFPTTANAYQQSRAGGNDLFIAKLDIEKDSVIFSTLIGGSGDEWGQIRLDNHNDILISGSTSSADFPVTGTKYGNPGTNNADVFVAKLNSNGSDLVFSTVIGGDANEDFWGLAVDGQGAVYISGTTSSRDYPVTAIAADTSYNGGDDAFLTKLSADGSRLEYSTFVGGSNKESGGRGIVVDDEGRVIMTGNTKSTNFPVTSNALYRNYRGCVWCETSQWTWGDMYILILNPSGSSIEYATYFGGNGDEEVYGIARDTTGNIYITGSTSSSNFPTTPGTYNRTYQSWINYITKFSFDTTQTGVKSGSVIPSRFELKQNYPNPFNPTTVISYRLPAYSNVKLTIYNVLGQKIKTLVNTFQNAGEHSLVWDATDEKNNSVSSGIYFYKLGTKEESIQKKMLLIR